MKLHELTDLAHKVWGDRPGDETPFFADLERFAALVAAAEREACAKVCDDEGLHITASIIRARGQE
jgi:hypothetical protein